MAPHGVLQLPEPDSKKNGLQQTEHAPPRQPSTHEIVEAIELERSDT
jgi:hypothetical protein